LKILTLTNEEVLGLASMDEAIDELEAAFVLASKELVESPIRTRFKMSEVRNILLMPSLIRGQKNQLGLKMVSVYPDLGADTPSTRAIVFLVDGKDGSLKCIMGGTSLTGLRTGAVSGLSCRYLARKDSRKLAVIGAGGQGIYQARGVVSQLKRLEEISVFDVDRTRAAKLVERCARDLKVSASAGQSVREAAEGADVVVTATTSKSPILEGEWIAPGAHVVAIGAYTPETRELSSSLVGRASIFVDSLDAAMEEAGDVLIPMKEGVIGRDSIRGGMADLASGRVKGRTSVEEVTLFKSVGLAFEDNAVGWMVFERAVRQGVGRWIDL
jgi:ornithine cyclodeaminase/alanine dehydrogenase-like protein (mu-crystallin family)